MGLAKRNRNALWQIGQYVESIQTSLHNDNKLQGVFSDLIHILSGSHRMGKDTRLAMSRIY
jgi:hypothetical protein